MVQSIEPVELEVELEVEVERAVWAQLVGGGCVARTMFGRGLGHPLVGHVHAAVDISRPHLLFATPDTDRLLGLREALSAVDGNLERWTVTMSVTTETVWSIVAHQVDVVAVVAGRGITLGWIGGW